jgi:CBS-domain-containing membrane protein
MVVEETLNKIPPHDYLAISGDCSLEEAAERLIHMRQIRGVYVVDAKERLQGYLSLGVLIRNVMGGRFKPYFHLRSLLARLTTEKVADIMTKNVVYARKEDDIERTLERMIPRNMKEIPIVDDEGRMIAVVGIIDLWVLVRRLSENKDEQ